LQEGGRFARLFSVQAPLFLAFVSCIRGSMGATWLIVKADRQEPLVVVRLLLAAEIAKPGAA
jgi:hypothetical protein